MDASEPQAVKDDEVLAGLARGGDGSAFEELVCRYQDRVFNLLVQVCGSHVEAEDLAQETFLKAFRSLEAFRQHSKFYTWIFRIAINAAISRGRKVVRLRNREGQSLDAPLTPAGNAQDPTRAGVAPADRAFDPEYGLEQKNLRQRVQEGLGQLSEEYRVVVTLRDMEGLDYDAIAQTLGITRAAVKSRLHRARLQLARLLKDLRPGERAR